MINKIIKPFAMGCFLLITTLGSKAQTVQQALQNIYQAYDSSQYITFDVQFHYTSDTLFGEFTNDILKGSYTMAGKKAKYNLGEIEFMQNDSFFIAVYKSEKFILVNDPPHINTGSALPLRAMMDSLVQTYSTHYTITQFLQNDTGVIRFVQADSLAQFKEFSIQYDTTHYFLQAINYMFEEPAVLDPEVNYIQQPAPRQKKLALQFSNYHFDNISDKVYSINNYIFLEEDGVYRPVEKYNDFQIYNSKTTTINVVQTP